MPHPVVQSLLAAAHGLVADLAAQATQAPGAEPLKPAIHNPWDFWPFGPGYGERWVLVIARFGFIIGILAFVALVLRLLLGPKGPLRDKWIDEEAAEETARELEDLERRHQAGEVEEFIYKREKKRLSK